MTSPAIDSPTKVPLDRSMSSGSEGGEDSRPRAFSDTRWRTASFSEPGRIVVVAIDASENARAAFDWYLENVHRSDDLIVLVHCPEAPRLPTFSFKSGFNVPTEEWTKIIKDVRDKTDKLEQDYEADMMSSKLRYKIRGESMKNPGEGICRIANDERANLVVIGTRGLSTVKRAVLGSVSDFVVRNSGIPTLIIPGKSQRKKSTSMSKE